MSVLIPLTQDKVAIIDEDDAERVGQFKWYAHESRGKWYAARQTRIGVNKQQRIFLHRWLVDAPDGVEIDHRNGNSLDNRSANLRECSHEEQVKNVPIYSNNTSGYKGVTLQRGTGRWTAYINRDGKRYNLGDYGSPEEAARAYDSMAIELHGEFARLNFPDETPAPFVKPRLLTNNTSGYRGVSYMKAAKKFIAYIRIDGQRIHLGSFTNSDIAAHAYDEAARAAWGERAPLNFPLDE